MALNPSPIETLKKTHSLLSKSAITQPRVQEKILKIFAGVKYEKRPFFYRQHKLWRAVAKKDEAWFDNIDKFGIAPAWAAGLNRCNLRGKPLFYGSTDNAIPIFEVRPEEGDFVMLSTYVDRANRDTMAQPEHPINFLGAALGVEKILENLPEDDSFRGLLYQDDLFKEDTPQIIKDVDRYVGELFMESIPVHNQELYFLTCAISNVFFRHMKGGRTDFQGLIYPSVAGHGTGTNVALTESYVKNNLRLSGGAMYQVLNYDNSKTEYILRAVKTLCYVDPHLKPKWQNALPGQGHWIFNPYTVPQPYDPQGGLVEVEEDCHY